MNVRRAFVNIAVAVLLVVIGIGNLQQQHEQDRLKALTLRLDATVIAINESRREGCERLNAYKSGLAAIVGKPTPAQQAFMTPLQRHRLQAFVKLSIPADCSNIPNGGSP